MDICGESTSSYLAFVEERNQRPMHASSVRGFGFCGCFKEFLNSNFECCENNDRVVVTNKYGGFFVECKSCVVYFVLVQPWKLIMAWWQMCLLMHVLLKHWFFMFICLTFLDKLNVLKAAYRFRKWIGLFGSLPQTNSGGTKCEFFIS